MAKGEKAKAVPDSGEFHTGQNIAAEVKDGKLVLTVDLSKRLGLSGSKKTIRVASSLGNQPIPGADGLKFGLNVYEKNNGGDA